MLALLGRFGGRKFRAPEGFESSALGRLIARKTYSRLRRNRLCEPPKQTARSLARFVSGSSNPANLHRLAILAARFRLANRIRIVLPRLCLVDY